MTKEQSKLLKGLAVSLLLLYHAVALQDCITMAPIIRTIVKNTGNICVAIFAFITVYGLTMKLKDTPDLLKPKNYFRFVKERLLKLYKSYWPAFIVGFAVAAIRQIYFMLQGDDKPVLYEIYGSGVKSVIRGVINFFGLSHAVYGDDLYTLNQTWWYMSLAILLVILTPLCVQLCKRAFIGTLVGTIAIAVLVPVKYTGYLPLIVFAVGAAMYDEKEKTALELVFSIFMCFVWGCFRVFLPDKYSALTDSLAIYSIITALLWVLSVLPKWLKTGVGYIGKHSANIFYLHSFLYVYWPTSIFFYLLHYGTLVWPVLMASSIGLSVLLEYGKRKVHWNEWKLWA